MGRGGLMIILYKHGVHKIVHIKYIVLDQTPAYSQIIVCTKGNAGEGAEGDAGEGSGEQVKTAG